MRSGEYGKAADYNQGMKNKLPTGLSTLLGDMSPEHFLAEYWQKKPLLVRGAVPDADQLISRDELFQFAADDTIESRLVSRTDGWQLDHGPFSLTQLKRTKKPWTTLVQTVNLVHPAAETLMRRFNFIPYARLDDVMVSYATDQGGVGPHFDNYDVFLIQGMGSRHWHIGAQKKYELVEDIPLRIIKNFRPSQDWVLNPGDMLYLPPQWAHDGVAIGECMTLSVGFRTPTTQELGEQFLSFLQDKLALSGRYSDPDLKVQRHPAEIGNAMIDQVATQLAGIRWDRTTIQKFLGASLTEPKPHVFFDPPEQPLSRAKFKQAIHRHGLTLAPASQLLFSGNHFYLNGDAWPVAKKIQGIMRELANSRTLSADQIKTVALNPAANSAKPAEDLVSLLYEAYLDGFLWHLHD
ncbi:MAG: 50S ribosomal protein L16 3-hydroxylase [Rugosibacter sp.]|jgi:50S ribosomal protein L16 3-hydroxylase|nr:50S ribosomal protein L16 3-hydroxylase [Rugosibacter sp.]